MAQLTLEEAERPAEGFRLNRLEVYNWGTFNSRVWSIAPGGSTALLTGANGSGKSTLVDALLTLLVPNQKRNYNQASGAERRRERDEKSYVRGAYGRIKDEEHHRGIVQYLRGKEQYSALLAAFANQRTGQELTLAHLFYWREDELKKLYILAPLQLSIAEHLQITGAPDELKKRLKGMGAEVFEEFSRYSREMIKRFRLRSDKALDLFNQTVSIKEIGGLNEFVRQHMLERTDSAEKINQLRETYQNLTRAHDAIARAEGQLARLEPLLGEADQHAQLMERIGEAERCAAAVPIFFTRRKALLLEQAAAAAQARIAEQQQQAATLQAQVDTLRSQERELYAAITNDQVGQQLQQLEKDLAYARDRRREKQQRAEKYNAVAKRLQFAPYADQESFFATTKQARDSLTLIDRKLETLVADRDAQKQIEGGLIAQCRTLADELDSLRRRKSRLPADDLRIRAALAAALELAEDELPFVGELLKVRENAAEWEPAIERLLGSYGRQMLVPEAHYRRVMGYVDATNLRGRLIYHRADPRRAARSSGGLDADALFHKLEIKPDADLHDWLRADLLDHWDYVCCTRPEQFQREQRALSLSGQIKRSGARHEKDDRYTLGDRTRYVLGWDNRDKIAALEAELATQTAALQAARQQIKRLETEQASWQQRQQLLRDLLSYDEFAAINWRSEAEQIGELERRQQELAAGSNQLARLREQLTVVEQQLRAAEADLLRVRTLIGTQENDIKRFERQLADCAARLDAAPAATADTQQLIAAEIKSQSVTLETIDDQQLQLLNLFRNRAASLRGQTNALERSLIERMVIFKNAYPEDSSDMDTSIAAISEYRRMHERIARDDLPTHRRRFKEWLDGKVVDAIVGFQSSLDKKVAEYRESIDTLNGSLRTIDYTGSTYCTHANCRSPFTPSSSRNTPIFCAACSTHSCPSKQSTPQQHTLQHATGCAPTKPWYGCVCSIHGWVCRQDCR